jgi:hypothetical protein
MLEWSQRDGMEQCELDMFGLEQGPGGFLRKF